MIDLSQKKVFITGGSRGIGAGIASYLAKAGAIVAISYTSRADAADQVLSKLPGVGHFKVKMDVSDSKSVDQAIEEVLNKLGQLDGLVNNAGITKDSLMLRMNQEDFDQVINTNLRGTFLCTKAILRPMIKARAGSIVNITSVVGQISNAGQANYAASKAGIEAFTKSLAKEVGSRGVRANCVAPGFIVTAMTDALDDKQKEKLIEAMAIKRLGQVEDIASAVAFLLSEESSYITGQTLSVNGGMYM